MRYWDRLIRDSDERPVIRNRPTTSPPQHGPSHVWRQRPLFSNPLLPESYEVPAVQRTGSEINLSSTDPVDKTPGNASEAAIKTTSSAAKVTATLATTNVSNPPTETQIISAFGTAQSVGKGFIGIIDDANFHTALFLCVSDGTNWHFEALSRAL